MLKEIYCRTNEDPGYNPNIIDTNSSLEGVLTKIRMILFTQRGEVMGASELGMNLEEMLFKFSFDEARVRGEFINQLYRFVPESSDFRVDLKVSFVPGTVRDLAYLNIYIDGTKYLGVFAK
jgi:hypothetical protein